MYYFKYHRQLRLLRSIGFNFLIPPHGDQQLECHPVSEIRKIESQIKIRDTAVHFLNLVEPI